MRKCRACKKPIRECVLPCRLADSAYTADQRDAMWLAHVYRRLNEMADRLDPKRRVPKSDLVAALDNAANNLGRAVFYLTNEHVTKVK